MGQKITVVGTGYLGATHAVCMAALGYDVLGVDVDADKVRSLAEGRVPFFEPGLPEKLREVEAAGRLHFTTDFDEAAAFADVHFICVGTPQQTGSYAADLRYVDSAFLELARRIDHHALLVGKSTVPVGTAERLTELVQEASPAGDQLEVAWNPEFLREGFAVEDTLHPDRLVFGVTSAWAEADAARGVPPDSRRRHPGRHRRPRDRGAGEGGRELVPRDQDLVHQRDGRGLRGDRSGCRAARPGAQLRRTDRGALPQAGARLRRGLPAEGHPGVPGPSGGARGRPGCRVPARGG